MITTASISVNPNPFTHTLQIEFEYEKKRNMDYVIWLIHENGRISKMAGVTVDENVTTITIDKLHHLSAGTYHLHIKNTEGGSVYSTRLVKE